MAAAGSEEQESKVPAASSTFLAPKQKAEEPARSRQDDETQAEKKRRADIRKEMLRYAQGNFDTLGPLASTGYAQQLQTLETDVKGYLSRYSYDAYDGRQP